MKSFFAFLRIIIVGILWGIVFTEGIRVIMLCNWHFDIFGKEHWQLFGKLWHNGWAPHDSKEWALVLLMITFFPMLFTGWWTLSLVAWEDIIWKAICLPYEGAKKLLGQPTATTITSNNRYGIVKRKSYKQIRPAGISTLRIPISDYGTTAISAPMTPVAASSLAGSSYAPTTSSSVTPSAPVKKKTDVAATIDHALFKFDDDDDDFDLDIDSFEKADINKKKKSVDEKPKKRARFDDDDDDEEIKPSRAAKSFDFDDDDDDFNDTDEDYEDQPKTRTSRKKETSKKTDEKEKRSTRTRAAENKDSARSDKPARASRRSEVKDADGAETPHSPVYDALSQKGYDVLTNITVGNTLIDFVGVSESEICFCLVDKETGDWLADEEMFNGEEPLWFSENSHRVSPVCKLNIARKAIEEKLEDEGYDQKLSFYVVIQMANIINADDMFEIWNNMKIDVTRINRGAPKEIKLLSKQLNEVEDKMTKKSLGKLQDVLKSLK